MSQHYKLAVFWTAWTPKVATRILRDLLSYQRLALRTRTQLLVACDEELKPKISELGFTWVEGFLNCTEARVYVAEGDSVTPEVEERIPECLDISTILVSPRAETKPLVVDKDPYAGIKFFKDWKSIPPTLNPEQSPPTNTKNVEPRMSPFI